MVDRSDTDSGALDVGPLVDRHIWVAEVTALRCCELVAVQSELADLARALHHDLIAAGRNLSPTDLATNRILNQMLNDFEDLLFDASTGRGRSAIRVARSLFEHLVNLRTVRADTADADRYMDHEPVALVQINSLDLEPLRVLKRRERRRVEHYWKKAKRRHAPAAEQSISRYGSHFARSWSNRSVRSRAETFGLDHGYDFYRVCSLVMHGAAGGSLGTLAEIDSGETVLRHGPAFSLCAPALAFGAHFVEGAFEDIDQTDSIAEFRALLARLRRAWPEYGSLMQSLDVWPEAAPVITLARVLIGGGVQWWVHDREHGVVTQVGEPSFDEPKAQANLEDLFAKVRARTDRTEPTTIGVSGAHVQIPPNAEWKPEATILVQRPLYVDEPPAWFFDPPRRIEFDDDLH